jgi:hypothetical protein
MVQKFVAAGMKKYKEHISLSTKLHVPKEENIPRTFLKAIIDTPIGDFAHNPAKLGRKRVKVTKILKRDANFIYNINK